MPESLALQVGEVKSVTLLLSSAIAATHAVTVDSPKVSISSTSPRTGVYEFTFTGLEAGEATVSLTATAPGYVTATASFPVAVSLRPLAWSRVPAAIEVPLGQRQSVALGLSQPVRPEVKVEVDNMNAEADVDCATGSCALYVTGNQEGESSITLTATAEGYTDATATIPVTVLLRELRWERLPRTISVVVGEQREVSPLRLSANVIPELDVRPSNTNIATTGGRCFIGWCELTLIGLEAGDASVSIAATAPGYEEATATIEVEVEPADLGPMTVYGIVSARAGPTNRIRGALVAAIDPETEVFEVVVQTGHQGTYRIENLEGDEYLIAVLPPANYAEPVGQLVQKPTRGEPVVEVNFSLTYDPITDGRFDRDFWNEFAFNAYECPRSSSCELLNGLPYPALEDRFLWILEDQPNYYIRTTGFSASQIRTIRAGIREAHRDLTGVSFFGEIEEGTVSRIDRQGWVSVESDRDAEYCGYAYIGADPGRIILHPGCLRDLGKELVLHEVGHALGFFHVRGRHIMHAEIRAGSRFTSDERYHAQLAYQLWRGMPFLLGPKRRSAEPFSHLMEPRGARRPRVSVHCLRR